MQNTSSILFASWHFYLDRSNGASISTRELLLELARRGWRVRTLCFLSQDGRDQLTLQELAERSGIGVKKTIVRGEYAISSFVDGEIESTVVAVKGPSVRPSVNDRYVYRNLLKNALAREKTDLVLTYGGYALGPEILADAKRSGSGTVVFLHNLSYHDRRYFNDADLVFVPSKFAADVYKARLDLETVVVPPLIEPQSHSVDLVSRFNKSHILFVNPELGKGVCFFLAIAKELWRIRPEIRFFAVEGREGSNMLLTLGKDYLGDARNVDLVRNTDAMAQSYEQSKITLIPSFYEETFGRVAAESLTFGTPVVAASRGALPEVVGDAGALIDMPAKFTIDRVAFPTSEEIAPWISAILRLWDDRELYMEIQKKGMERARSWDFSSVADRYESQLRALVQISKKRD